MTNRTRERAVESNIPDPISTSIATVCDQPSLIKELISLCKKGGYPMGNNKMKESNKIHTYIVAHTEIATLFAQEK